MGPLETLLWVYPLLLLLNGFVAIALWVIYRQFIFGLLVGVWASTLLNFVIQGFFLDAPLASTLAFSSYIAAAWFLCYILSSISRQPFSFRSYWAIYLLGIFASISAHFFGVDFSWAALPVAIAVALPQISFAIKALNNNQLHSLVRIFAIVLMVNGLHFIDYPFLRPIPDAAVFGYSLVIATSMLFGVLLPCVINNFLADELNKQLRDEISNHKKTALEREQALRAKTVFLANVSHHLRTPINGIMGLNDLLLDSTLKSEQQQWVQHIRASSNELLSMVDNVLTISLLESEKVKLFPKAVSLQHLVNEVFDHYASSGPSQLRLINQTNITHSRWIYADALKIRQICFNLIDNALKHSEGSSAVLEISLNDSQLDIVVQDNGIGVAPEQLGNLALPFKQDVQSIHYGMGLGLSIARELTSLMAGQLQLESALGKGLRAHCQIPVEHAEGYYVAPSSAARIASEQTLATSNGNDSTIEDTEFVADTEKQIVSDALPQKTIPQGATPEETVDQISQLVLVVEDNPVNRMVISGMLKKLAVNFCMAEDGSQAMTMYHQHKNNLACILMDVQLPDANGLDLVESIRAEGDKVPVLVISAFTFGNDEARALEVGANAYLRKPYHFDEFKNALDDLGVSSEN